MTDIRAFEIFKNLVPNRSILFSEESDAKIRHTICNSCCNTVDGCSFSIRFAPFLCFFFLRGELGFETPVDFYLFVTIVQ